MGFVWWVLVIVLAAGGGTGWRLMRYPGGWRYAFDPAHNAARHDLGSARGALRGLRNTRRQDLAGARAAVRTAAAERRRRIRELEQRIADLREPGRGALREELGPLRLHQHALVLHTAETNTELPLYDIALRSDHGPEAGHVYVVAPDGRQHLLTYPVAQTSEERLRRFVVDVHNAIADAKSAQRERASRLPEAEAELRRTKEDVSEQAEAQVLLEEATARWNDDTRIPKARKELEAARERWQALTGHRPR